MLRRVLWCVFSFICFTTGFSQGEEFDVLLKPAKYITGDLELIVQANENSLTAIYKKVRLCKVCTEYFDGRKPDCTRLFSLEQQFESSFEILRTYSENDTEINFVAIHGNSKKSIVSKITLRKNNYEIVKSEIIVEFDVPAQYYRNMDLIRSIYISNKEKSKFFIGEKYNRNLLPNQANSLVLGVAVDADFNVIRKLDQPLEMKETIYFNEEGDIFTITKDATAMTIWQSKLNGVLIENKIDTEIEYRYNFMYDDNVNEFSVLNMNQESLFSSFDYLHLTKKAGFDLSKTPLKIENEENDLFQKNREGFFMEFFENIDGRNYSIC